MSYTLSMHHDARGKRVQIVSDHEVVLREFSEDEAAKILLAPTQMKFSVACPVCGARLEWIQGGDTSWGTIDVQDIATAQVTAHDGGAIRQHMAPHIADGSWHAAVRKHLGYAVAAHERLAARDAADAEPKAA